MCKLFPHLKNCSNIEIGSQSPWVSEMLLQSLFHTGKKCILQKTLYLCNSWQKKHRNNNYQLQFKILPLQNPYQSCCSKYLILPHQFLTCIYCPVCLSSVWFTCTYWVERCIKIFLCTQLPYLQTSTSRVVWVDQVCLYLDYILYFIISGSVSWHFDHPAWKFSTRWKRGPCQWQYSVFTALIHSIRCFLSWLVKCLVSSNHMWCVIFPSGQFWPAACGGGPHRGDGGGQVSYMSLSFDDITF